MAFIGTLTFLPRPGCAILIAGKATNSAKCLEIDLLTTKSDQDNLILHLCMNLEKQTLTMNTKTAGIWCVGHQIKLSHISAGATFQLQIVLSVDEFLISVLDGSQYRYPYRTSIDAIGWIRVSGNIEYVTHLVEARTSVSTLNQLNEGQNGTFTNNVIRNFINGDVIVIRGLVYGDDSGTFSLLLTNKSLGQTIFKLTPRFEDHRVTYAGDVERCELEKQHSKGFPFDLNKPFKLAIGLSGEHLLIGVDGEVFLKFKFRQAEQINGFSIVPSNELQTRINSVDHFNIGDDQWESFDSYSNPDCTCTG